MRVALIGAGHWHAPHYYRTCAGLSDVDMVGVSDPDEDTIRRVSGEIGVPGFRDPRALLDSTRPDFVFVLGRHADLAALAMTVIEAGVPCLVEKPGGISAQEVRALRDAARARSLYATTGYNFLVTDFARHAARLIEDDEVTWASFRFIAGGPQRYLETGCGWMLDPALSGGGSTINLSIHFFDLFRRLSRADATVAAAVMGHDTWRLPVEDHSVVVLRSPSAMCSVETGYTYPGPAGIWDLRFAVRTRRHHLILRSDNMIEIISAASREVTQIPTASAGNSYWYPRFVEETLRRFRRDEPPIATLDDLVAGMETVDAAYAAAAR